MTSRERLHQRAVRLAARCFPGLTDVAVRAACVRTKRVSVTVRGRRYAGYQYPYAHWNFHQRGQPVPRPRYWFLVAYDGHRVRAWLVPGHVLKGPTTSKIFGQGRGGRKHAIDGYEVTP